MSLRELPPDQADVPRSGWRRRLRFIPLVLLAVLAVVMTVVGTVVRVDPPAPIPDPSAAPVDPGAGAGGVLPDTCHPAVDPAPQELWLSGRTAEAEAVWQSNFDGSTAYYEGKDGWVDWSDLQAANLSQAVGRRYLTRDETAAWHEYFATIAADLAERGVPFYIVVAPAKWGVYPQQLPEWAAGIRGSGPLDQLLTASPDLPLVDLRQPLREASADYPVFSRVNSHWTDYGAYAAWNEIAACISATSPQLGAFTPIPIDGVELGPDRNEFADYGIENPSPDWTIPAYSSDLLPVTVTAADGTTTETDGTVLTGLLSLPVMTETPGAQSPASALVLRDSFGDSLSVPLQQAFSRTWQVAHDLDFPPEDQPDVLALIAEHEPDVVIFEIAQRHLNFPPARR